MAAMTTAHAREHFSELINQAAYGGERIVLTRRGKGLAAVIPIEDLRKLEAEEDASDVALAQKALKTKKTVPWVKVKKALGL